MKDINVGWIGLGARGRSLIDTVVIPQGEKIVAVCDLYEDRRQEAAKAIEEASGIKPKEYEDFRELINDSEVNVVVIASAWENHTEASVCAMEAGKPVALEVGGAYDISQCYDLVNTYEKTKTPFMFLENCCFGKREMMVLNMVEHGFLGEIVHCEGAYAHDLRDEVAGGKENRHYRLKNYLTRNCDNYPTHDLGPIAKILKINNGNRMLTLTSFASKAVGVHDYIMKNKPEDEELKNVKFAQADIVTTLIKCANGETISLRLDTTLPRYYSRNFIVRGTNGMFEEVTDSVFMDCEEDKKHDFDWGKCCFGNASEYEEKWNHPVWKKYIEDGVQGTHDGMDWLQFKTFFNALRNDEKMPIDVYDAASWMAVSVLSEISVAKGGAVMEIPDFTRGKWHLSVVK